MNDLSLISFPLFHFHSRGKDSRRFSNVGRRDDRDRIQPRARVGVLLNNENRKANSIGSE